MSAQKISASSIKTALMFVTMCVLALGLSMSQANAQVPGVIIDQDMSSDHDDAADLALVNALANLGQCTMLACMADALNGATPLCQNAINTYYGHPNVPCGVRPDVGGSGSYPGTIASEFPHPLYQTTANCPIAVTLYRQILASQPNNSVVIITTGFLTNLAALLESGPDQYSPLNGVQLVAQKVKLLSCAGGAYPEGNEFDFTSSADNSAYIVVNNWPTAALFVPFDVGQQVYPEGQLQNTPSSNPVRTIWLLTTPSGSWCYPCWGQMAGYYGIRTAESQIFWSTNSYGHNNVDQSGTNCWVTDYDPTGAQDQGYLIEKMRYPVQEAINTLVMALPPSIAGPPSQPTNVRATVANSSTINLQWTDNSYNESGFIIERQINGGSYTQIATVGAGVTTYSDTTLSSTANISYQVMAYNGNGNSPPSYVWVYSGWTEVNFGNPSQLPLYEYYQCSDLEPTVAPPGGAQAVLNNHVTINNDSTHGQDVTINVYTSGINAGNSYVYFFYQNSNNWYRLNASSSSSQFQKDVNGTITAIGAAGPQAFGGGRLLQEWEIVVSHTGTLQFINNGNTLDATDTPTTILNVTDSLSFSSGKIGLGGYGEVPIWQNFNFSTTSGSPASTAPAITSGTLATIPIGTSYSYQITATNSPTSYNALGLPAGLSINTSTGAITGKPTTPGASQVFISATNANGTGTTTLTLNTFNNGSGISLPAAPTNLTATAGNTEVTLNWTASPGALAYDVYRGTTSGGESPVAFATDVPVTNYVDVSATNGTTYYYTVVAINDAGNSSNSGEASATPSVAAGGGIPVFVNSSFETPVTSGATYEPAGATWTFTNYAGIQGNGSVYSGLESVAPNGTQTAFLQGVSGTLGTMSQTMNFPAGTYTISFYAAQRFGQVQPVQVSVDGTAIGTYTPTSTNFAQITTAPFTVAAGNHTVTFAATSSSSDKTSFIDLVSLSGGPPNITSPTTAMGIEGNTFSYTITAGNGPTSYNATGLPMGLMVNKSTGVISGTPTVSGAFPVMITASSATGTTTVTLTLTLAASTDTPTMPQWALLLLATLLFFVAAQRKQLVS
ncbi:MAG: putative Ig domain-containing protein [Methylacidiphilales bacterium]|nr:putative Ig domain-containing protein [Candidatus Methylacidiphilales bacterium]